MSVLEAGQWGGQLEAAILREAPVQGVQCLELGSFSSSAGNILRYQDIREVFRVINGTIYSFCFLCTSLRLCWGLSDLSWEKGAPIDQTLSAKGQEF